jgi:hypothetical protein
MSTEDPEKPAVSLRPLQFDEQVYVKAFPDAISKAIEASDDACGTILTASFSIATAYGAAIALVTPKDAQSPAVTLAPFIILALAVVVAMIGKAAGVSLKRVETVEQARASIKNAVWTKRIASWVAIVLLAAGMVVAGAVVYATFGSAPA